MKNIKVTGPELKESPLELSGDVITWNSKTKYTVKQFLKEMPDALIRDFKLTFTTLTPTPSDLKKAEVINVESYGDESR